MSLLDEHDAIGLAGLVAAHDVSSLELVDEAIARIESRDSAINAVVHRSFERARATASSELSGPFAGVPFLLKDLRAEDAGEPCTGSCRLLKDWRATEDCELVARFKRAGVVTLGRTNTPEFGLYAVTEPDLRGATRNPWDHNFTPGGSSGGSAAAVAAGMVPFAHAGDGGGSIRIPAAHCGLFGMKPTRARNPSGPFSGEGWAGLTAEHVVTRSVRDSAVMLDCTRGPDLGAPYEVRSPHRRYSNVIERPPKKLRIAYTADALFGDVTHPDCVAACEDAAALAAELGHTVELAHPHFDKAALIRAYLIMVGTGTATSIRGAAKRAGREPGPNDIEPATRMMGMIGDRLSATEYVLAQQEVHHAGRRVAQFFDTYDVLLTPTAAKPPVPIGTFKLSRTEQIQIAALKALPFKALMEFAMRELPRGPMSATPNTMLFNLTGQPAMSTPLHWNASGLPIGTQWVGRFGDEATLFQLGAQLELARPWFTRRPKPWW